MNDAVETALSLEQLGIIGVLGLVVITLVWAVRFLYNKDAKCEEARLQDAKILGEMKGQIGELKGEVRAIRDMSQRQAILVAQSKERSDSVS